MKEDPDTTSAEASPKLVCATKTMDGRIANLTLNTKAADYGDSLDQPLVWIDLEMTGLDIERDRILEIACIITDGELVKMVKGPDLIINQPEECLQNMDQWCQEHHTASGLVEEVRKSKVTEEIAEKEVLGLVLKHCRPDPNKPDVVQAQLAGNSVYTDLFFLKKYMPRLAKVFSHVIVDVSSVRSLCYRWSPQVSRRAPVKKKSHRALEDIRESIIELKYLKRTFFRDFGTRVRPDISGHPNQALHYV